MLTHPVQARNGATLALYTVIIAVVMHLWWLCEFGDLL
jgi:hypothetical protein